jgi:periplasmic protein TonB
MGLKPDRKVVSLPRRARHGRHERWKSAFAGLNARLADLERRFAAPATASAPFTVGPRMRSALFCSAMVHLAIIFGVGFTLPAKPDKAPPALEVILVNAKSKAPPEVADAQAQHNLDGGGNTDEKRRAQSPLPVLPDQKPDAEMKLALRRVEQLEREVRQVMTQPKAPTAVETAPPAKAAPVAEPEHRVEPQGAEIMQRSLEIARLEAKISRDWDAYQQRPRRHYIGARAREYRFARYVEDWRQKIERVGDLNYPQAARDQRLHGRLVVTVAIKADGTVEDVALDRPSGHKVLDEAARRIVRLAAPFAAFPPDIAKDIDVLHITRTWTFTTGDRFVSE